MLYRLVMEVIPDSKRAHKPSAARLAEVKKRLVALGFKVTKTGRFCVTGVMEEENLGVIGMPPGQLRLGVQHPPIEDASLAQLVCAVEVIPVPPKQSKRQK
jgi:hypothetical protein